MSDVDSHDVQRYSVYFQVKLYESIGYGWKLYGYVMKWSHLHDRCAQRAQNGLGKLFVSLLHVSRNPPFESANPMQTYQKVEPVEAMDLLF